MKMGLNACCNSVRPSRVARRSRIKGATCLILAAASLSLSGSRGARADWDFTKWWMTEAQVLEAANEHLNSKVAQAGRIVQEHPSKEEIDSAKWDAEQGVRCTLRIKSYFVVGWDWRVTFCFGTANQRLAEVRLERVFPAGPDLDRAEAVMHGFLGRPYFTDGGSGGTMEWFKDPARNISVTLAQYLVVPTDGRPMTASHDFNITLTYTPAIFGF
jgi:hypothetical protein